MLLPSFLHGLPPAEVVVITTLAGKLFLNLAETMPPPPEKCGFWCRWCYDLVQRFADNSHKIGDTNKKV